MSRLPLELIVLLETDKTARRLAERLAAAEAEWQNARMKWIGATRHKTREEIEQLDAEYGEWSYANTKWLVAHNHWRRSYPHWKYIEVKLLTEWVRDTLTS